VPETGLLHNSAGSTVLQGCGSCSWSFFAEDYAPKFFVLRWQEFSGAAATPEGDGRSYEEIRRRA
jgi:hypothetical protein